MSLYDYKYFMSSYHVTNKPKDWWEDKLEGIELV